mgnify:FL=1
MLTIRKGIKTDLPFVLELIKELADYENEVGEVSVTLKQLEDDGFCKNPSYQFLVAESNKKIIGMAFYFIRYSTWKGKMLFLEDFIVNKEYRRMGVGNKLFSEIIKIAQESNLNGMCWQVLDWNEVAINFYRKYNAGISGKWLNGKLTKTQINTFNHLSI